MCDGCALRWEKGNGNTDICCGDRVKFYEDRCAAALALAADVERILSNPKPISVDGHVTIRIQTFLFTFASMIVLLSSFRQFAIVIELFQLLMAVLEFEEKYGLEASLTISQALRIHLPMEQYKALYRKIALMSIPCKNNDPEDMAKPVSLPLRARVKQVQQVEMPKDTLAFLLFDLQDHPLAQLMVYTIILFCRREDLNVLIYALAEPDLSCTIVKELVDEFKGDENGKSRWIQLDPNQNDDKLSELMKQDNVTFLVDLVGNQHGSRKGLRFRATHAISFLNDSGLPPESARSKWTQFVVDASMLNAVDRDRDTWIHKDLSIFSSWQPPLHPSYVDGVERGSRRKVGSTFNIFINTSLDRIPPAEMLWTILHEIPAAVLYFCGSPEGCIPTIMIEATEFARKKNLFPDFFHSRVVFWGHLPLSEHIQRIRDIIDLAFTYGHYPGHTSTNACLTAGTPVLTVGGFYGGGGAAAWVPAGMLMMLGLAFMVMPNDEKVILSVVDAIKEFIEHPEVLRDVGELLDKHAREHTSFFDQNRTMDDLTTLMHKLSAGEKGILDCASRKPEPQLYSRGANGKLDLESTAALSPLHVCLRNPVEDALGEIWCEMQDSLLATNSRRRRHRLESAGELASASALIPASLQSRKRPPKYEYQSTRKRFKAQPSMTDTSPQVLRYLF